MFVFGGMTKQNTLYRSSERMYCDMFMFHAYENSCPVKIGEYIGAAFVLNACPWHTPVE